MLEQIFFSPFRLTGGKPVNLPGGNRVIFLGLHRVKKDEPKQESCNDFLDISIKKLEFLLLHLKKQGAEFVDLNTLTKQQLPGKLLVHFTFDDGYKDTLENALPLFEKYKIPFTLFLTSGIPDGDAIIWWYLLEKLFNEKRHLKIAGFNIDINTKKLSEKKQLETFDFLHQVFRENYAAFKDIIDEALIKAGADNKAFLDAEGLSWKEVRTLSKNKLCAIGNHTHHHFSMVKRPHAELMKEINQAQKRIIEETGIVPQTLALPFGTGTGLIDMSQVEQFSMPYAFTMETGIIRNFSSIDKRNVPRYFLNNSVTPFTLNMMINGMRHHVNKLLYMD